MQSLYGENKEITDKNYDKSLSVTCNNGIFIGKEEGNVISYKGIPYAKPPINDLRWKDPVLAEDSNKIYEAFYLIIKYNKLSFFIFGIKFLANTIIISKIFTNRNLFLKIQFIIILTSLDFSN